jgi:hypothetical protein
MKKIILFFIFFVTSLTFYGQKYKVTYSGNINIDIPCLASNLAQYKIATISLDGTQLLGSSCGSCRICSYTNNKEDGKVVFLGYKPNKIYAEVTEKTNKSQPPIVKSDQITLNLKNCDNWSSDAKTFKKTGADIEDFSFSIEPVIALVQPNASPSCTVHISADDLGFSSDIYNWWYTASDNVETLLPARFQGLSNFDITLEDIFVLDAAKYYNQNIKFKIKYCQTETKPIIFNFVRCSPELAVNPPDAKPTKCKNDPSGSVTLEFKTELKDGDRFLFNLFRIVDSKETFDKHHFVSKDLIKNNKYTWAGLAEGTYTMKYQAQTTINENKEVGLSAIIVNSFTIGSPAKLVSAFEPLINPACHNDDGSITINTTGGTGNYRYKINTDEFKPFTNPTIIDKNTGIHSATQTILLPSTITTEYKIYVTDQEGCIEYK